MLDLQYLATDGETFFHEERQLDTTAEALSAHSLGIELVDIPIVPGQRAPVRFTFRSVVGERWEGRYSVVAVNPDSE